MGTKEYRAGWGHWGGVGVETHVLAAHEKLLSRSVLLRGGIMLGCGWQRGPTLLWGQPLGSLKTIPVG